MDNTMSNRDMTSIPVDFNDSHDGPSLEWEAASEMNDKNRNDPSDGATRSSIAHQHFKMYKPAKVLTQFVFNHRKRKRRTLLGDVVSTDFPPGIMAIGRLDEDSEGLLLLTTNGKVSELVRQKSVEKEYWVQVDGQITVDALRQLQEGVEISLSGQQEFYKTLPCKARILETIRVESNASEEDLQQTKTTNPVETSNSNTGRCKKKKKFNGTCNRCGLEGHKALDCPTNRELERDCSSTSSSSKTTMMLPPGIPPPTRTIRDEARHGPTSWLSITITEGKNRQVRKMTASVGFATLRLLRVRIGSITLDGMGVGEARELDNSEISCFL